MVVFSLASPNFMQTGNMLTILQATSVNGVLAIAATLVIISGGIDLIGRHADDLLRRRSPACC